MRRAVDLAKHSTEEPNRSSAAPVVGVVITLNGEVLGEAFRGEHVAGQHAEFGLLDQLRDSDLLGATVYTTLEPCSIRNHPKVPCAQHLVDRGVSTVFIGIYDPNPTIYRQGWRVLRDAGVEVKDFAGDLRAEIAADNSEFIDQFRIGRSMNGAATFDYLQNDGRFTIQTEGISFETRWTLRGQHSIYAYDPIGVAHARYAHDFAEIDDPGALEFSSHSAGVAEGEIVAFRNDSGYVLVRIERVLSGEDYGDSHTQLSMTYQVRLRQ